MNPHQESPGESTDPKLVEAMHRYLLGDLGNEEIAELERQLLASTESRRRFLWAVGVDAALHDEAVEAGDEVPSAASPVSWWKPAAAAAAILMSALAWWALESRKPDAQLVQAAPAAEIATLGDDRSCEWSGARSLTVNSRLSAGKLDLESGVALIEFDGGARLALQGPASLELIGPKTARLHHGSASVRCDEGLYSFSLLTPNSVVTDIGTEFGVTVNEDGGSEVHVLDGEVEIAESSPEEQDYNRFLGEGETLLLTPSGEERELEATNREWIRDYTTELDREARAAEPRLIACDRFPSKPNQKGQFSQGSGWAGSWWHTSRSTKGKPFYFTPGHFAPRHGEPRLAMLVGGGVEIRRVLAEAIDPRKTRTLYLGFSLYRVPVTGPYRPESPSEAAVILRGEGISAPVVGMALDSSDRLTAFGPGGTQKSARQLDGARPQFVVARIEWNPHLGHRVSMIAYDQTGPIPVREPEEWDLVTPREFTEFEASLDRVAIMVRRSAFKFGEINLGNSWQAVVDPEIAEP